MWSLSFSLSLSLSLSLYTHICIYTRIDKRQMFRAERCHNRHWSGANHTAYPSPPCKVVWNGNDDTEHNSGRFTKPGALLSLPPLSLRLSRRDNGGKIICGIDGLNYLSGPLKLPSPQTRVKQMFGVSKVTPLLAWA